MNNGVQFAFVLQHGCAVRRYAETDRLILDFPGHACYTIAVFTWSMTERQITADSRERLALTD